MCALLTVTEYAKTTGKSQQYVSKLISQGRLTVSRGKINTKTADRELKKNRRGGPPSTGGRKARAKKGAPKGTPGPKLKGPPKDTETMFAAQARKARAAADLEEMKAAKERGELVDKSTMERVVFVLARMTRDNVLRVPSRVRSTLAAELDEIQVGVILDRELRQALEHLDEGEIRKAFA
jgi:hypothetical protein